ncbi:hypothetical protein HYPSUDRAFT_195541 [Hypholoma sublateritium FD-334 SS-4]|uniref:intramembrane prenyl-peptidase Rce1 n=1 Tax=Hypholoma sublateritium (strain FD-334 SS-4) TaxID=945553 RepID=A0A0D2NZE3_HYPSF|nr:hypothetical protein HYPSUDRAFT_195541 [Hypholoma sublateritium FD-334 SS-4]
MEYAAPPSSTYWLLYRDPLFSAATAQVISLLFGTTYVGVLYLSQRTRASSTPPNGGSVMGTRDDPKIIRARLVAVTLATLACCVGIFVLLFAHVGYDTDFLDTTLDATLLRLGLPLSFSPSFDSVRAHLVVPALFLGPLFASALSRELPLQRHWRWRPHVVDRFCSMQGVRNYALGPLTEELVFRACVLAVWHMAGIGRGAMISFAPLIFGLAHIHHGLETFRRYGRNAAAAKRAIFTVLFQLAYTTVFGQLASFLFMRTGSILPPVSAHIFCNIMGMPDPAWEVQRHPRYRVAIYAAYGLGIATFITTLWRWTATADSMYWPMFWADI